MNRNDLLPTIDRVIERCAGQEWIADGRDLADIRRACELLLRRDEALGLQVQHLQEQLRRTTNLLASIHMRCSVPDVTLPDGTVRRFVPPDPAFYWRELSGKIREIEAELGKVYAARDEAIAALLLAPPL